MSAPIYSEHQKRKSTDIKLGNSARQCPVDSVHDAAVTSWPDCWLGWPCLSGWLSG